MADMANAPLLTRHKFTKRVKVPSIDDMIETYIGATGSIQLLKAIIVAFAWAFDAQQVFISVFTDAEPGWHHLVSPNGGISSSSMAAASPCDLSPGAWAWDQPAETSVVSEWALNCAGPALVSLPASSFFAGCLAGGFLLTTIADSVLGRKKMLLVSLVFMSIVGVLTAFATNVWTYAVLRFIGGFARSMIGTCTLILSTELVGKKWRDMVSVVAFFCYTLGFLSLPIIGYMFRQASWRNLYLWTSVPCLLYAILLYFLAQESPRWLLVRGRKLEAIETLREIASLNGSKSTVRCLSELDSITMTEDDLMSSSSVFATLQTMWERRWPLRRLAAISTAGFGAGMVYFGMPLNVGSLGSNLFMSVAYNALAELPSNILLMFLVARINRRSSVVAFSVVASVCSLACVAIPQSAAAARMAAELVSFFATCTAFNIILIYSIELFPTSVRSSAVGLVRQAMVLGGVAAPVLVALGRDMSFLSFGVFGLAIGSSSLFVICLPETRGRAMSDTMEEEEECHDHQAAAASSAVSRNSDYNLV